MRGRTWLGANSVKRGRGYREWGNPLLRPRFVLPTMSGTPMHSHVTLSALVLSDRLGLKRENKNILNGVDCEIVTLLSHLHLISR